MLLPNEKSGPAFLHPHPILATEPVLPYPAKDFRREPCVAPRFQIQSLAMIFIQPNVPSNRHPLSESRR